LDGGATP